MSTKCIKCFTSYDRVKVEHHCKLTDQEGIISNLFKIWKILEDIAISLGRLAGEEG